MKRMAFLNASLKQLCWNLIVNGIDLKIWGMQKCFIAGCEEKYRMLADKHHYKHKV